MIVGEGGGGRVQGHQGTFKSLIMEEGEKWGEGRWGVYEID